MTGVHPFEGRRDTPGAPTDEDLSALNDRLRAAGVPVVDPDPDGADEMFAAWWQAGEAERSADRQQYGIVDSECVVTSKERTG